jgi:hypothetical protein
MPDFELYSVTADKETGVAVCVYRIPGTNEFKTLVYPDGTEIEDNNGEPS